MWRAMIIRAFSQGLKGRPETKIGVGMTD